MGDEEFDLDDDLGLDDGDGDMGGGDADSDFAGSLDNVMDDDDAGLGGGGDGAETELDSFFEDLSSIDDMDSSEPPPAAPAPQAAAAPAAPAAAAAAPAPAAAPSGKSGKGKFIAIAVLLAGLAGGGWWYMNQEPPEEIISEELSLEPLAVPAEEPMPVMVEETIPTPPPKARVRVQPKPIVRRPPPPPVREVVAPTPRYLIQVGSCSFDKCKRDYANRLRDLGYPVYYRTTGERYDFIELVTKGVYPLGQAQDMVMTINSSNERAGVASLVHQANGYRVTLGTFTSLDTAKDLKFYLEGLLVKDDLKLNLEHVRKNYETIKVFAGPYSSSKQAKRALGQLRLNSEFTGSFLVRY